MYPGTVPMGNCARPVIQNPGTLHALNSPVWFEGAARLRFASMATFGPEAPLAQLVGILNRDGFRCFS